MANRPSRIEVSIPTASSDGKYYGRYPKGNAPIAPGALSGIAAAVATATGSLSTGGIPTYLHGQSVVLTAVNGTGFGTKSRALAPLVSDTGLDAPIGSTSSQFNAVGSKLPLAAGGIYNIQNQPPGFAPSGALIGAPSPFHTAITAGCHKNNGDNDSNGVYLGVTWVSPNVSGVVSYPYCLRYEYWYRYDPNMFNDPESDNNTKTSIIGTTNQVWGGPGGGQFAYWDPFAINPFPISNVTLTNPCVVTCPMNQASAPVNIGDVMAMFGTLGTTQVNNLAARITNVTGGFGAWIITLALDATGFSPYAAPLVISAATNASPCRITLSTVSATHPLLLQLSGVQRGARLWATGALGGTWATNFNKLNGVCAVNLGGSSGAWTADLVNGQFTGLNIDSTSWGTYTPGSASVSSGGLSVPYSTLGATQAQNTYIAKRTCAMNPDASSADPRGYLQNPDANGAGMNTIVQVKMPSAGTWIRRRVEYCFSNVIGVPGNTGPGYYRIYDDNVLVWDFVGRTDDLQPPDLNRYAGYGSAYHRDRGVNNFVYLSGGWYDISAGGVSGQCAAVYVGDNANYASCTVLEPQIADIWLDGSIRIKNLFQGQLPTNVPVFPFVCTEAGAKGTAVIPKNSSFIIGQTSLPTIANVSLPSGNVGIAYPASISISGGTAPFTYYLPNSIGWLSVNASTGALTGTPTAAGTYQVTLSVRDANGLTGFATLPLMVT